MQLFATETRPCGLSIMPRDYQGEAADNAVRIWDSGVVGALVRAFTGAGKTIIACMLIDRWLNRGPDYRAMVLSYEIQLCDQFADEIEDVLGRRPGMERESQQWSGQPIVVASRQTLLPKKLADDSQKAWFAERGVHDVGLLTSALAKTLMRQLSKDEIDAGDARAIIGEHNCHWMTNQDRGVVSRVHRFDWRYNWLIVADEAHKFVYKHKSIGHLYDWFAQNDKSRWLGITATPKRADGVSIGHKLFPGVALDFPLYSPNGRCAVKEGYAVPYRQKYICVEGVDFKSLKKVAGDFDESDLERVLGTEEQLARLVDPMLDMCEARKTLIFSPTVQMAKDVSAYINARVKCQCDCGKARWYPSLLIGDGAQCPQCNELLEVRHIVQSGDQCHVIHEAIPPQHRKEIYHGHQAGKFQFLSVCGLCKEGYNDPDIACVAVFRPVSKAASSLAEQMKGRGSRPLRGLINGLETATERREAIAHSDKPDCLIVDLVGITGLADCASTALIYAEGLPDEVRDLATDLLADGEIEDVEAAIEEAKQRVEADKERIRQERMEQERRAKEEAQRRAKADADVSYSAHEMGTGTNDPSRPTDKMMRYMSFLGITFSGWEPSRKQAKRIIDQLQQGMTCEAIAYQNGIPEGCWEPVFCSAKQLWKLRQDCGYRGPRNITRKQASDIIEKHENPAKFYADAVLAVPTHDALNDMAHEIVRLHKEHRLTDGEYQLLINRGRSRRQQLEQQTQVEEF
jgi:superfamily II DNA or RNA helicase